MHRCAHAYVYMYMCACVRVCLRALYIHIGCSKVAPQKKSISDSPVVLSM